MEGEASTSHRQAIQSQMLLETTARLDKYECCFDSTTQTLHS